MSEEDILLTAAAAIVIEATTTRRNHRPRRFWVRPSLVRGRQKYNAVEFMKDLILDEADELNLEYRGSGFTNFFRMKTRDFEELLRMIGPIISKKDTNFRKAIPASVRLAVTLRFLASGDSYISLSYTLKISKQSITRIVPEVCSALISVLKDYVKMPNCQWEWKMIAKQFSDVWNFPHCIGAVDGKHIVLQAPIHGGSEFFNYKSFHSIVLFAVVDANYNFIYVDVGCQGRISDGGVFNNTTFKQQLDNNTLQLPPPCPLPGRTLPIEHCLIGDEAFQLTVNLMKPFSGLHDKGSKQRIFNYRLSRARRVSENAFGILSASFRVLRKPMLLEPEIATKVTLTTIHLHNYLRKSSSRSVYSPHGFFDMENSDTGELVSGLWRQDISSSQLQNLQIVARRSSKDSQNVRNEFAEYFCSAEGELLFQYTK